MYSGSVADLDNDLKNLALIIVLCSFLVIDTDLLDILFDANLIPIFKLKTILYH